MMSRFIGVVGICFLFAVGVFAQGEQKQPAKPIRPFVVTRAQSVSELQKRLQGANKAEDLIGGPGLELRVAVQHGCVNRSGVSGHSNALNSPCGCTVRNSLIAVWSKAAPTVTTFWRYHVDAIPKKFSPFLFPPTANLLRSVSRNVRLHQHQWANDRGTYFRHRRRLDRRRRS